MSHGTVSDDETIRDTRIAQPLIFAATIATVRLLSPEPAPPKGIQVVAGHSVGEIAAATLAGVLPTDQALRFVVERGRAMAAASAGADLGMSAVIGGSQDAVLTAIAQHGLVAANHNGSGQFVAAGQLAALRRLAAEPPSGTRVLALPVAGAFHSAYMEPALAPLRRCAATLSPSDPLITLLSNADGSVVRDGGQVLGRLVEQVRSPVRWDLCMRTMRDLGVSTVIELPPAGALTGLVRRELSDVTALALRNPGDLESARRLLLGSSSPT